jgi:flagellar basal-body rod modification protein FlgD
MAAAISGIWNHAAQATSPLGGTKAAASPLGGAKAMDDTSGDSSNDGATISANDFLTLLVTEMQNQDPTADTDPNEYINQLVNVNSLEQLININQTLSGAASASSQATPASGAANATAASATAASATHKAAAAHAPTSAAAAHASALKASQSVSGSTSGKAPITITRGNLNTPAANPSALRVARSLDGPRITR